MLVVPAPPNLHGDKLREELASATGIALGIDEMTLVGAELRFRTLRESDRARVEPVVAAHTGGPTAAERARDADEKRVAELAAKPSLTNAEMTEAVRLLLRTRAVR